MGADEKRGTARHPTSSDWLVGSIGCIALVAGILVLSLAHGTVASTIGICLLGICGIAFVALMFLLVGESEDRERAG